MPIDYYDPQEIRFRNENDAKIAKLRAYWFSSHRKELKALATFKDTYKGNTAEDVRVASLKLFMPACSKQHQLTAPYRFTKSVADINSNTEPKLFKTPDLLTLGLTTPDDKYATVDLTEVPKMRAVDPNVADIIYKGIPNYGRKCYLKVRSKIKPERKYYFPECSSFDYGWRFKDSAVKRSLSKFGMVSAYKRSNESRTGPHADPSHYKHDDITDFTKCHTQLL